MLLTARLAKEQCRGHLCIISVPAGCDHKARKPAVFSSQVWLSSCVHACAFMRVCACVCVHSPLSEIFSVCQEPSRRSSFNTVPSLPTKESEPQQMSMACLILHSWSELGARLAHRSGELHCSTVREARPQSLRSCPLSPFFTSSLPPAASPYPGPSCSLQSCHYSPSPQVPFWSLVMVVASGYRRCVLDGKEQAAGRTC